MRSIEVTIAEPCHEQWEEMTPKEQGRFCNACAKTVVDFTIMTDTQVLHYLLDKKAEHLCGRFLSGQLNTAISSAPPVKQRKSWPWNVVLSLFLLFTKADTAKAQKLRPANVTGEQLNTISPHIKTGLFSYKPIKEAPVLFTGRITDATGYAVPFASVTILHTGKATSADASGIFSINMKKGDTMQIAATSFKARQAGITDFKNGQIALENINDYPGYTLGEIAMIIPAQKKVLRVIDTNTNAVPFASIKSRIYNKSFSVDANGQLTIALKKGDMFSISAPGFKTANINTNDLQGENIILERDTASLKALVIITGMVYTKPKHRSKIAKPGTKEKVMPKSPAGLKMTVPTLYPNPVQAGNNITLLGMIKKPGLHTITVFNSSGMSILKTQVNVMNIEQRLSVGIDKSWIAGACYFKIVDSAGASTGEGAFIVQ